VLEKEVESTTTDGQDPMTNEPTEVGRRQFLRQAALAGAGMAGLALLEEKADAAGLRRVEQVLGIYTINLNNVVTTMRINNQSGNSIAGFMSDGTTVTGTIAGAYSDPVTISFARTTPDGSSQIFFGAVSALPTTFSRQVLAAGTYYHNGLGPFPWVATASIP
jgi:hypothetical protein